MRIYLLTAALYACSPSPTETTRSPPSHHASTTKPVALAVVFDGSWGWMGNMLSLDVPVLAGDVPVIGGAYLPLRIGLDAAFAELPAGSETTLVSYSRYVYVIASGPSSTISSVAIGGQGTYANGVMSDLLGGIDAGIEALGRSRLETKLLIVIGDGTHFDREEIAVRMGARKRLLRAHGITAVAFVLKGEYLGPTHIVGAMPIEGVVAPWSLVAQLRFYLKTIRVVEGGLRGGGGGEEKPKPTGHTNTSEPAEAQPPEQQHVTARAR
jgi:hypothetical protein